VRENLAQEELRTVRLRIVEKLFRLVLFNDLPAIHVPAGVYAKHALQKLGQWDALADRLVYAKDVRGALALVERGDAAAGIVYATDAKISRNVQEVDEVPGASNLNIAYPLAVVAERNRPEVTRFLDFLKGPEARRIFSDFGFTSLVKPPAPASATN